MAARIRTLNARRGLTARHASNTNGNNFGTHLQYYGAEHVVESPVGEDRYQRSYLRSTDEELFSLDLDRPDVRSVEILTGIMPVIDLGEKCHAENSVNQTNLNDTEQEMYIILRELDVLKTSTEFSRERVCQLGVNLTHVMKELGQLEAYWQTFSPKTKAYIDSHRELLRTGSATK